MLGKNGNSLDMLIDRQEYKGFSAVYGQQIAYTGQIIGCASPRVDALRTDKDLMLNTKEFLEIIGEFLCGLDSRFGRGRDSGYLVWLLHGTPLYRRSRVGVVCRHARARVYVVAIYRQDVRG